VPTLLRALALATLAACATQVSPFPLDDVDPTDPVDPSNPVDPEDPTEADPAIAAPTPMARLTATQLRNTVLDLLGGPLPDPPLPADTNPYLFFSIGAASTSVAESDVQRLEEAADAFAERIFDDPARRLTLLGCTPAQPGDACVASFLQSFGQRAYRRPLQPDEQARWLQVSVDLADGDPWTGARLVVQGLLQSPHLLYRVELGEPDPADPALTRLTAWELASRLSYLLWNTTPDDALLTAAASGELHTTDGLSIQIDRLLADPRARTAVQDFFAQYLDLGRLDRVTRDATAYPQFSPGLLRAMRTEVELVVDDLVFRRDTDVRKLFSLERTYVNDALAALYGLDAPGATEVTFVPAALPADGPRAGLLTLGAFLTMNAHEVDTSPTLRGKYLRERVLCATVPAPPDDVDLELPEAGSGEARTLRERLEQHRVNPNCAGCHAFIDPPGYLFEHFDAIGGYRTLDAGHPIDSSGDLDGTPLADAKALAAVLADHPQVGRCMVKQLHRHAQGRLDTTDEWVLLDELHTDFAASGFRFTALLRALVMHPTFRRPGAEVTP
jgi:hypothetical protein